MTPHLLLAARGADPLHTHVKDQVSRRAQSLRRTASLPLLLELPLAHRRLPALAVQLLLLGVGVG